MSKKSEQPSEFEKVVAALEESVKDSLKAQLNQEVKWLSPPKPPWHVMEHLLKNAQELLLAMVGAGASEIEIGQMVKYIDEKKHELDIAKYESVAPIIGKQLDQQIIDELAAAPAPGLLQSQPLKSMTYSDIVAEFVQIGAITEQEAKNVQQSINEKLQKSAPASGAFFFQPQIGLKVTGHAWHMLKNALPNAPEWEWEWKHIPDIDVYELHSFNQPYFPPEAATHHGAMKYGAVCWGGPIEGKVQTASKRELMTVWPPPTPKAAVYNAVSEASDPASAVIIDLKKHLYRFQEFECDLPYRVVRVIEDDVGGAVKWWSLEELQADDYYAGMISGSFHAQKHFEQKWKGDLRIDYAHYTEAVWIADSDKDAFMASLEGMVLMLSWGLGLKAVSEESSE